MANRYARQLAEARAALAEHDQMHASELSAARSVVTELGNVEGDLTPEQTTRFTTAETSFSELTSQRSVLEAEVTRLQASHDNIERMTNEFLAGNGNEGPTVITGRAGKINPFDDVRAAVRSMSAQEVQSRARTFVETAAGYELSDTQRAKLDVALRNDGSEGLLARHIIGGMNPAYVSAFEKMARSNGKALHRLTDAERSAMDLADMTARTVLESSDAAGGFLVPPLYDPTVIYTGDVSVNPLRQVCNVRSISGPKLIQPSVGNVAVGYLDEAVEVNESLPVFADIELDTHKFAGYITASYEALEDTSVQAVISELLQRAKDEREAIEFLVGDGAPGHILGLITAIAAVPGSVVKTKTAGTFTAEDVYRLRGSVRPQDRALLKWLLQDNTALSIREFASGGNQSSSFWATLGGDTPELLLGRPTYEVSKMDTASPTDGSFTSGENIMVAGDFQKAYTIVDRRGMTVEFDALVKGPNGRPNGKRGWFATWRTGGGPVQPNAARLLQVK